MKKRLAYLMACSLLASPLQATLTEAGIKADLKADLEVTLNLDYPVSNYEKMELKATLLSEDNKVVAIMPINGNTAKVNHTKEHIVFEDIPQGIMAGKNAGMRVCAVEDDYSMHQMEEKKALADYYIKDYYEIMLR